MGNSEEEKSSKSDKPSLPTTPDQTNIHVFPDWSAMQAYYGSQIAFPSYYNSAAAPGHAPHPYVWGPLQPMMPPYGIPYAALYSPGGVYTHPAIPMGLTPLGGETPTKSTAKTDHSLMKTLKGCDGLSMSPGNGNAESADSKERQQSQSADADSSRDDSDGKTSRGKKRSRGETPTSDQKTSTQANALHGEVIESSPKVLAAVIAPAVTKSASSPGMSMDSDLKNTPNVINAKTSPGGVPQPYAVVPSEAWLQNEKELKRERRKQSNRESARRSRLRKQGEAEELAHKVESLTAENVDLKSEISQLSQRSKKLKLENTALMEKLQNAQGGRTQEFLLNFPGKKSPVVRTENLLSRVNDSDTVDEGDPFATKLHQLLDPSPRADAVAAS